MRKVTTILCSIAFMISGIMLALTATDLSPGTGYKSMNAATAQSFQIPKFPTQGIDTISISDDLVRDLAKQKGVLDTVYVTKTDTIKEQVTKVKVKKVPVPSNVMEINVVKRTDTIQVPVYYLATQVGVREEPTGKCVSVYEVHKVDEICPEVITTSVNDSIEHRIMGDD